MKILTTFLTVFGFFGCAGGQPLQQIDQTSGKTGILVHYEVNTPDKMIRNSGCTLVIARGEDSFQIPLPDAKGTTLVEAPAGQYKHKKIFCGASRQWDTPELFTQAITVSRGKISYLGRFTFNIKVTNTDRNLSALIASREDMQTSLYSSFETMGEKLGDNLVSAYSGKRISFETVQSDGYLKAIIGEVKDRVLACEKAELKKNPVAIGKLSYVIQYKKGELAKFEKTKDHHTFSDDYIACAEQILKEYRPTGTADITYNVSL